METKSKTMLSKQYEGVVFDSLEEASQIIGIALRQIKKGGMDHRVTHMIAGVRGAVNNADWFCDQWIAINPPEQEDEE